MYQHFLLGIAVLWNHFQHFEDNEAQVLFFIQLIFYQPFFPVYLQKNPEQKLEFLLKLLIKVIFFKEFLFSPIMTLTGNMVSMMVNLTATTNSCIKAGRSKIMSLVTALYKAVKAKYSVNTFEFTSLGTLFAPKACINILLPFVIT